MLYSTVPRPPFYGINAVKIGGHLGELYFAPASQDGIEAASLTTILGNSAFPSRFRE